MKRFILSSLSLVVAAGTIAPAVNAQEIEKVFDLQASRLEHLDNQTKSDNSLLDTTLQQRRISELNQRTKGNSQSSDDSLVGTTLQQRRISELNQRTKDNSLVGTTLQQRLLEERNARTK